MNGLRPAPIPVLRILENAALDTDMDCQHHVIRNAGTFVPVPPPLLSVNDFTLDNRRPVPDGSVTDDSVAATAGIQQSKLSLNGVIPTAWLGTGSNQAGQGNLVQFVSPKGATNGYSPLDATGKIPVTHIPASLSGGTGSVTSVSLSVAPGIAVSGSPITGSGEFITVFKGQPSPVWFGNNPPRFNGAPVPNALVPSLDAATVTTGTFDPARLPIAVGVGVSNAPGAVPAPGDGISGLAPGHPRDYLARDMSWRAVRASLDYQPNVPAVQITFVSYYLAQAYINLSEKLKGAPIFYEVTPPGGTSGPVQTTDTSVTILVDQGARIDAYAAKAGYNMSLISTYTVPYSTF